MGTWLQGLVCLQERAIETEVSRGKKGYVLGIEKRTVGIGCGQGCCVYNNTKGHQAWLQRLQDWGWWWRTFCSSSNLGFLLELGDRYFFFPPGSRGGYDMCENPEGPWQLSPFRSPTDPRLLVEPRSACHSYFLMSTSHWRYTCKLRNHPLL
jgi:hypothetical protein